VAGESPIPGLKVAGPDDRKALLPMQVAMDYRWLAWFNRRVVEALRQGWHGRLTHLQFVPDVAKGLLYMVPAAKGAYGAIPLKYGASEAAARLSLYLPLLRFELTREKGRRRLFAVEAHPVDGVSYLALNVGESKSVPAKG
jgi:hypothetical protein